MIKKSFAAIAAALLLWVGVDAQPVLQGKVTNQAGECLPGATVQIVDGYSGSVTGPDGLYTLKLPSTGEYTLKYSFVGYQSEQKTVSVVEGINIVDASLALSPIVSEAFTVSAVRASQDEPISQVTRGIEAIERNFQGQDAGFLLEKLSPSIVTYSESGSNFSNYSGFRLRGMDQTRVNMTLNGVPLNDMIDQGVFFSNFTDFGNSIQSVQIQRGVGTSTNGTSSYAGSINFESINVFDTVPSAEIQLTGGSFNTLRASAEVQTGRMDNDLAFYARYAGMTSDGFRDNTSTDSRSFFLSGAYFIEKHTFKFTGFLGRSQNGLGYSPVAISDIERDPTINYISPNDRDDFGQSLAQFQHHYQINRRMSLTSTAYYGGAGGDFPFGFEDESGTFTQINYPLYNDHLGLMSQFSWNSADGMTDLDFGVHGYSFFRENIEQIVPNFENPYYEDESRKDEVSAFAKARKTLGNLTIFADLQVRGVELSLEPDRDFLGANELIPDRDWLFINPKLGVSYNVTNRISAYASLGRTGREPTRFDILGSTQINAGNIAIAQDIDAVDPEYVNDLEAGLKIRDRHFAINANFFYMQFENEIAPIGEFIPEGFVQVYENQESSYRTGVELDYEWNIFSSLRFFGNATWMQSRISSYSPEGSEDTFEDVSPILSPDWNVQTSLEYEVIDDLFIAIRTRYLSESFLELTNDPDLTVPESFVTDFGLRYTIADRYELKVDLNNAFDELYFTNGAPVSTGEGVEPGYFVQPPRSVFATFTARF
jgi:iron complex outermembrane receptor protein